MAKNIFYRLALMLAALMFSPTGAFAASIDEKIDKYFAPFSDVFSSIVFYPADIAGVKIPVVYSVSFDFKHCCNLLFQMDWDMGF